MSPVHFAWDENKATANLGKHGVTFEEARSVFYDECAIEFYDEPNSADEDRFLMLGMSARARLLLVSYSYRERETLIRIISARRATKAESAHYHRC